MSLFDQAGWRTGSTDWTAIATLYDGLVAYAPSIGAHVARAAAHGEAHDIRRCIDMLGDLPADRVAEYQPYWAVTAHLLQRLGRHSDAHRRATGPSA